MELLNWVTNSLARDFAPLARDFVMDTAAGFI
jgi:hypothetical protein